MTIPFLIQRMNQSVYAIGIVASVGLFLPSYSANAQTADVFLYRFWTSPGKTLTDFTPLTKTKAMQLDITTKA